MNIYCIFLLAYFRIFLHIWYCILLHFAAYFCLNLHIMAFLPVCILKHITHMFASKMQIFFFENVYLCIFAFAYLYIFLLPRPISLINIQTATCVRRERSFFHLLSLLLFLCFNRPLTPLNVPKVDDLVLGKVVASDVGQWCWTESAVAAGRWSWFPWFPHASCTSCTCQTNLPPRRLLTLHRSSAFSWVSSSCKGEAPCWYKGYEEGACVAALLWQQVGGAASASSSTAVARFASPPATWTVCTGSTRLTWAPATMKTGCLSIRPALRPFVAEATQRWLSSVQICAVEISGADVAVACEGKLASSPCMRWKTNSVSCWQLKINQIEFIFMDTKIDRPTPDCESPSRKPELRKLKPNPKTRTAKAQAENPRRAKAQAENPRRKLKPNQKTRTSALMTKISQISSTQRSPRWGSSSKVSFRRLSGWWDMNWLRLPDFISRWTYSNLRARTQRSNSTWVWNWLNPSSTSTFLHTICAYAYFA